jgi:hypothetical protein
MGRFCASVVLLLMVQACIKADPPPQIPEGQILLGQAYFNFSADLLDTLQVSDSRINPY